MFFSLSIFKAHMQSSIVVMLFIVYVRKDRMDGWMVRLEGPARHGTAGVGQERNVVEAS